MKIYLILLCLLSILPATCMEHPRKRGFQDPTSLPCKAARHEEATPILADQGEQNRILHSISRWGRICRSYCKTQNPLQGQ